MAEIGTPENPEIIDPSLPPPRPPVASRWRTARQILTWLVAISMPAVVFDLLCVSLFRMATTYGGILPWLALFVLILPAVLFSLVAFAATLVLLPAFLLTLMGRAQSFSMNDPRLQRFVRFQTFRR